nr:hypothetical protein [Epidermidibacterium keratini]
MPHFGLDVFAVAAGFEFIEDVGDGFHRIGHVPVTEVLFSADELDTERGEALFGDDRIAEVTEGARAHVNDDVVDTRCFSDILQ